MILNVDVDVNAGRVEWTWTRDVYGFVEFDVIIPVITGTGFRYVVEWTTKALVSLQTKALGRY
jgi:hypothetical protein